MLPVGLRWVIVPLAIGSGLSAACPAVAQSQPAPSAPACTTVPNVARATLSFAGADQDLTSNVANLGIEELLDVRLSAVSGSLALRTGAGSIAFALTNAGNGPEAFALAASINRLPTAVIGFAVDRDGDGAFDPAIDLRLTGATTASIGPGQSLAMLVLLQVDASGEGVVTIAASAVTGSGAPGTSFTGTGTGTGSGGCDAIVGGTGATASLPFTVTVDTARVADPITLLKSQAVVAPDRSAAPIVGATVTYTVEASFSGPAVIRAARFADPIPAGTAYLPGSLQIDGAALSDADDADAGSFDGTSVRILLGDVDPATTRTIQFKVTIQ